jgi:hypothetical protein
VTVEQRLAREAGMGGAVGQHGDTATAWTEHLAIGSTWGALYGALQPSLGLGPVAGGVLLGATAYAVDMMGIGPALGLVRGPWNLRLTTAGERVMAHLVYGVVTGIAYPEVRQFLSGGQRRSWAQQPPLPFAARDWHTPTDAPAEWQPAQGRYGTVGAAAQAEASRTDTVEA